MKKRVIQLNHTLFDVAAGGLIFYVIGIPLLILIGVIVLVWVSVRLIKKAHAQNNPDSSGKNDDKSL